MIEDIREFPHLSGLSADLVIVGSGPAGLAIARRFIGTRKSVLILEAGGARNDLAAQEIHWSGGAESDPAHPPLHLYRRRVFGGASTVWGGRCVALDPSDLVPQPGVRPESWPLGYGELAGYYPAALEFLDAGACEFEAAQALHDHPPSLLPGADPSLDLGAVERFSRPTNVASKFRKEFAASANVRVLLGITCLEVTTTEGARATTGVRCRAGNRELRIAAPIVVLANGGLESVRLLLTSNAEMPTGLGNQHGLLGRYYMTHLTGESGQLIALDRAVERELRIGRSRDRIYCQRVIRIEPGARERAGILNIVFRPTVGDIGNPAHRSASLSAYYLSRRLMIPEQQRRFGEDRLLKDARPDHLTARHIGNVACHLPEAVIFTLWWAYAKRLARRRMPIQLLRRRDAAYALQFTSEQVPNPESRLVLSNDVDPFGIRRLSVLWRATEEDRHTIRHAYQLLGRSLADDGRARIEIGDNEIGDAAAGATPSGGHHIGAARMSSSAADGVVDSNLGVWGTQGLYVASAAVFPTSGTANPTLTVVALSLRLAEHLTALAGA